jgi:SSS family solute:Na+ symporter
MPTLSGMDYAAIGIYMALVGAIGIFMGGLVKDVGSYFKGGGSLPWVVAGISNYMTLFSTFIFVAYAGIAYEHGLVAVTVLWSAVLPSVVAAGWVAKRWRRAEIMTPVEFLETRFNAPVRQFFSWGGIGFRILDNMVRLYAIGIFLAAVTPLSLELSILVAGVLVVVYTMIGGLWAVVVTDAVQFVVLGLATLVLVPLSLRAAGGLPAIAAAVPEHLTFNNGPKGAPFFLFVYYLMVLIKYNANWAFIQRFYSVRDEVEARKVGWLTAALFVVSPIFFLLPPLAARVIVPGLENPEMAYASVSLRVLPSGIMGLMVAAMFAATMSTLSSELNVTAGVFTRDIYQRVLRAAALDAQLMRVGKAATMVLGGLIVLGALFVGRFGGAFQANMILTGIAIPLAIPLVYGILWRRARPWGAMATVLLGVPLALVLNAHSEVSWEVATLSTIAFGLATMYVSGLVPHPDPAYRERVSAFFARLAVPIREEEKPVPEPAFQRAYARLMAAAMVGTGLLFVLVSLPSTGELSGTLALAAGLGCVALGLVIGRGAAKRERGGAEPGGDHVRTESSERLGAAP